MHIETTNSKPQNGQFNVIGKERSLKYIYKYIYIYTYICIYVYVYRITVLKCLQITETV